MSSMHEIIIVIIIFYRVIVNELVFFFFLEMSGTECPTLNGDLSLPILSKSL